LTPGATQAERLEQVLAFLAEAGYRNIEPFSFHGLTAEQFDALAQEYGLKVLSRHMSTNEANWPTNLADAKLLGQRYTGSGGFASPGINSYQNVLATAETLNRLGELSVKNGTGPIFGHNHAGEFTTRYVDVEGDGTLKSAWQILVENTDPRYVTFQLDVGWATIAGEDAVALVEEFGDRIDVTPGDGARFGDVGFLHGHTWPAPEVLGARVICIGHEHPAVKLEDSVGGSRVERAWLRGPLRREVFAGGLGVDAADLPWGDPELVVFPAFNERSGGTWVNVEGQGFLAPFLPDGLESGEAYLLDGTRLGEYRSV
jgi:hypothetical protein